MHRLPLAISLLLLPLSLMACQPEYRIVRDGWSDYQQLADSDPRWRAANKGDGNPLESTSAPQAPQTHWAIRVAEFTGNNRGEQATALVEKLRSESTLGRFWIEELSGRATVYQGQYPNARSPDAAETLAEIQQLKVAGRSFERAAIVEINPRGRRVADPHDLSQFFGFYSLQVGFYDEAAGDRYAAAEQAVRALREEGHDAYYYHGPNVSLVTVGLFTYDEAFVTTDSRLAARSTVDVYGPPVRELQKQFPHNLGNGRTLVQKVKDKKIGDQPSLLVRVR